MHCIKRIFCYITDNSLSLHHLTDICTQFTFGEECYLSPLITSVVHLCSITVCWPSSLNTCFRRLHLMTLTKFLSWSCLTACIAVKVFRMNKNRIFSQLLSIFGFIKVQRVYGRTNSLARPTPVRLRLTSFVWTQNPAVQLREVMTVLLNQKCVWSEEMTFIFFLAFITSFTVKLLSFSIVLLYIHTYIRSKHLPCGRN